MPTIAELVARRTDLSTFVVHLTRDVEGCTGRDALFSILKRRLIEARTPMGIATKPLEVAIDAGRANEDDLSSQRTVCFTETPLEHLNLLIAEITDFDRQCNFAPYGVALTKKVARLGAINPIWYVDITPAEVGSYRNWLTNPINEMIEEALARGPGEFAKSNLARITPFIEAMGAKGPPNAYRKEFWWEREWRHHKNVFLPQFLIVIAPEADHNEIRDTFDLPVIDSSWGMEAIIARLAGFGAGDVGPF